MNRILLIIALFLGTFFTSCVTREKQLDKVTSLSVEVDSILRTSPVLTVRQRESAGELIEAYNKYTEKFPEDSLSPKFMMKSALLYHALGNYLQELKTLELIVEKYPDTDYAPQALATGARVSEENINDLHRSRYYLKKIQEEYPESPYAINIDLQIEYVGDADGLLNAIMARRGINLDSLLAEPDSVDTVKK
ncbi:MAG: tol-pal system YbgF family protein [Chitinophagales bacterium]